MSFLSILVEKNQIWASEDYAHKLKVRDDPVGLLYRESFIIKFFHTGCYSSKIMIERFGL